MAFNDRDMMPTAAAPASPVPMRVLARRVQFVLVMRVFDRADPQTLPSQLTDQRGHEGRLAAVLAADDVNAVHRCYLLLRIRVIGALGDTELVSGTEQEDCSRQRRR